MSLDSNAERELFQAAICANLTYTDFELNGLGNYFDSDLQRIWEGWQLARAHQQDSLPVWQIVTHKEWNIPRFNQPVLLCLNGVLQTDVWEIDQADSDYGTAPYFWFRNDCDECPKVKEGDMWMPLESLRALLPPNTEAKS